MLYSNAFFLLTSSSLVLVVFTKYSPEPPSASACEYNLILPLSAFGALGATAPSILKTSRTTTSPVPLVSKINLSLNF